MYLNKFENNSNTNNTNINNSNNNNNNENNINKNNNIPVFWAIITTQKLRFIYLSPSLKSLIYNEQDDINFLIGTSLYDYIVPSDIKQIKYNIHSYINSGEFMEKSFRVRIANFIDISNKYSQQIDIPKKILLEEVSYVNCNLMLNVISEFNMLAFFYPYPENFESVVKKIKDKS
ncbi:hypothetical protein PIROE2DRAFT_3516 [Piromyces sp. E2]|nr:hypothetical protein PIROE2DRAFT_3516 [Piromyces sp. E2]|eukprot:OUM68674.1 hypothetical protein PIROE2DRAFT_3516 [Piromyces sp. E2]